MSGPFMVMMKMMMLWSVGVVVATAPVEGTVFADEVDTRVVGIWQTTDLRAGSLTKEGYLVLRADKTGGAFGVTEDGEERLSYEFTFEPVGDDIRLKSRWANRKGKRRDYEVSSDDCFHFDRTADEIVAKAPHGIMRFRPAPETMKDPYRLAQKVSRKDLLSGFWRGGSEFRAYSIALSPSGEALLTFAVGGALGTWNVNADGNAELHMRDPETGTETVFTAVYDAQADSLRIGNNVPIARNLKVKPEDAIGRIKGAEDKRRREEMERRECWKRQFEEQESTQHFGSLSEVLAWGESGEDVYFRSVRFPEDVNGLSDSIFFQHGSSSSVRCRLACGLAEEGKRPDESALRQIPWKQRRRPEDMPPDSVTNDNGIAEVKSRICGQKQLQVSNAAFIRVYATGRMCRGELWIEWKIGECCADEVARILQPRFESLFPCDLTVCTMRRRAQPRTMCASPAGRTDMR